MNDDCCELELKIVLAGSVSVGKTSLLNNFLEEKNPTETMATIGTEYYTIV